MDSGDWRLGQSDDRAPWTERSAGSDPSPDLWGDEPEQWIPTQRWAPRQPAGDTPASQPSTHPSEGSPTSGGYPTASYGDGSYGANGSGGYAVPGYPVAGFPAPTSAPPSYPTGSFPVTPTSGVPGYPSSGDGTGGYGSGSYPQLGRARHRGLANDSVEPPPPEPAPRWGLTLGLVAGWYAAPVGTYLIWFLALAGERRDTSGRQFVAAMPWLLVGVVVSMGLCAALRRVAVGWRAVGLSFASAVIGAGIATIVHSFAA